MSVLLKKEEEDPLADFLSSASDAGVSANVPVSATGFDFDLDDEEEKGTQDIKAAQAVEDTPDPSKDDTGGKNDRPEEIKGDEKSEEESDEPHTEDSEDYTGVSSDPFIQVLAAELGEEPDAELIQKLRSEDPDEVKVLAGYMREVIKRKSVPQYASEEVAAFDKAVREGIDPRDYLELSYTEPEYKDLDLSDADTRHIVIENYLKATTKLSDANIQREIGRMERLLAESEEGTEDGETMAEIREYADYLQEQKDAKKAQEIEAARRERVEREERAKSLEREIKTKIMSMENVGGFALTEKDKQGWVDYLLLKDKTGKTQFQKEIEEDPALQYKLSFYAYKKLGKDKLIAGVRSETSKSILKSLRNYKDTVSTLKSGHAADTPKSSAPVSTDEDWVMDV